VHGLVFPYAFSITVVNVLQRWVSYFSGCYLLFEYFGLSLLAIAFWNLQYLANPRWLDTFLLLLREW